MIVVGLVVGSFLNVVICRMPEGVSVAKGRSMCPNCFHVLAPKDLVPVFSYIFLKGRCRYCSAPISPRYPVVELIGALCAAVSFRVYGISWTFPLVFLTLCVLTAAAFVDWDTMEIPPVFNWTLAGLGVLFCFADARVTLLSRVIGFFAVSVPMLLLTLIIKDSFGGGDIKLVAVCGLILGWQRCLLGTFLAILTGGAYGIYLLATKKKGGGDHFAFGPFLAFGMGISLLFGFGILEFYLGLFR